MPVETIRIDVQGVLKCGNNNGPDAAPGDQVKITLDRTDEPNLPEFIFGIIQAPITKGPVVDKSVTPAQTVPGTYYEIDYELDDLNGEVALLKHCHVLNLECVTCCYVLETKLAQLRLDSEAADALIRGDFEAADVAIRARLDAIEALLPLLPEHRNYDWFTNQTFNPSNPETLLPAQIFLRDNTDITADSNDSPLDLKDGDTLTVVHDITDGAPLSGDEFVIEWRYIGGSFVKPKVLEWPQATVTREPVFGCPEVTKITFRTKSGQEVSWLERPTKLLEENFAKFGTTERTAGDAVSWQALAQWEPLTFAANANDGLSNVAFANGAFTVPEGGDGVYEVLINPRGSVAPEANAPLIDFGVSLNGTDPNTEHVSVQLNNAPTAFSETSICHLRLEEGDTLGVSSRTSAALSGPINFKTTFSLKRVAL